MNEQIDKKCKDCLHYKMCLERFKKLKKENRYILIDESEYFAHADDCEFHIKSDDVARKIFIDLYSELVLLMDYKGKSAIATAIFKAIEKVDRKYTESEGDDDGNG